MSPNQGPQSVRWVFTLNNYTEQDLIEIERVVVPLSLYITWGKEVGEEAATPHLQGYVEWKTKKRLTQVKKLISRAHWEIAKSPRASNVSYCQKQGDFFQYEAPKKMKLADLLKSEVLASYNGVVWKPWQQSIVDLVDSSECSIDDRRIHWYWDLNGNIGKSFVCTYLAAKHTCVIASGKRADVFNQIRVLVCEQELIPRCVIVDIPREQLDYFQMSTLEVIKNRVLYSGKFDGGQVFLRPVHVIVFANKPPVEEKASKDRWNIIDLTDYDRMSETSTDFDI